MRHRELRRFADSVMTCVGTLTRMGTEWTIDPETGLDVPPGPVIIWEGRCLVYPADRDAQIVDVGGQSVPLVRYTVILPAGTDVVLDDVLEVTQSPDNANQVGSELRITDAPLDAWEVARHCMAEVVTP